LHPKEKKREGVIFFFEKKNSEISNTEKQASRIVFSLE